MFPSHIRLDLARPVRRGALFLAIVGLAAGTLTGPMGPAQGLAPAANPTSNKSSEELRAERREVQAALEATEDVLARAGRRVNRAVATFTEVDARWRQARIDRQDALAEARGARAEAQAAQIQATRARMALDVARKKQEEVRGQIEDVHLQMDAMARAVYTKGPLAEIEVVLSADSPGDFTARLASVDTVSRMQSQVRRSLATLEGELVMQGVRLETLKIEADTQEQASARALEKARKALAKAKEKQEQAQVLRQERQGALQQARKFRGNVKRQYDELLAEQQRLAAAARRAAAEEERRRKEAEEAARKAAEEARQRGEDPPPAQAPAFTPTGSLMMPVTGRPSSPPGPRVHPIFNRQSCHTGWDIAAPTGTPIVAADNGSVASISNGGAYGKAVMIAHGDGLITFYAHMNSIGVKIGQIVSKGETIGTVGSTGWSTGPHLHFETRINGTPYDPRGWFGGSRTPIRC